MNSPNLEDLFKSRPFKIRNADEYDVTNILNLFVSPTDGLSTPFDYENSIVKGRMGSGKTMYLRANYAYFLSRLVPSLMEDDAELILPVFIKLNDFQHIQKPEEIYRAIIIKIIEELTSIYLHLSDSKILAGIHSGLMNLPQTLKESDRLSTTVSQLAKLASDDYIEKVNSEFGLEGGVKPRLFEFSANYKKTNYTELKGKTNPGIKDIEECYKNLLEGQEGRILLLIDEAGSLDNAFFKDQGDSTCFFEILMNQFRTASFVRTKIAVYPNSYSDMLTETRYGDVVTLEDNVKDDQGYQRFRVRTINLIKNYINPESHLEPKNKVEDIFVLSENQELYGDAIEQLLYSSNGNMRRLIQLLDLVMSEAFSENNCPEKIKYEHAHKALERHASKMEEKFSDQENEFLDQIATVCRSRGAFKFQFPNVPLYKYTSRSQEYNLINVELLGTGRRGTVYSFDYSYCVYKDIPTHRHIDSEKIQRSRSMENGRWLHREASISQELIKHASLPGKIEGQIDYLKDDDGIVLGDDGENYYFRKGYVIEPDQGKHLILKKRVRFYPEAKEDVRFAISVEIL